MATGVVAAVTGSAFLADRQADGSYTLVDSTRAMFPQTGGQIRT
ncbi:hypothetical protein [Streptomyces sp. NPDC001970]